MKRKLYAVAAVILCLAGTAMAQTETCGSTSYNPATHFCDSRDNKLYRYVTIGGLSWMAENLNYDVANGTGSWCYENNSSNCNTYGRLYNWATATTACPTGWHLPSAAEWTALISTVGGSHTAGVQLKQTSGWSNNGNGENNHGFSALPGGRRDDFGVFELVGENGAWWTATDLNSTDARGYTLAYNFNNVNTANGNKNNGHSVRCVAPPLFGSVPKTGLPTLTSSTFLMIIFGLLSAGLWVCVIVKVKNKTA